MQLQYRLRPPARARLRDVRTHAVLGLKCSLLPSRFSSLSSVANFLLVAIVSELRRHSPATSSYPAILVVR